MELADLTHELERRLLTPLAPRRLSCSIGDEDVLVFLRNGRLRGQCTCGVDRCEHFARAIVWLCERASAPSTTSDLRVRSSLRPPAPEADLVALADTIDALILAIVRAGTSSSTSPTVRDATEQLIAKADKPTPLGLARWLGRLHEALAYADPGKIARVLDGARRLSDELRRGVTTKEALQRRIAWLGPNAVAARMAHPLEDALLIELAREWVSAGPRERIERRYLMDLARGDVLREEHVRAAADASVGPCPRLVQVAFGEIEVFGEPKRVRLLQYAIQPQPTSQHWAKVERFAHRLVRQIAASYAAALSVCPAIAEPFVVFAPRALSQSSPELVDADGERLAISVESERASYDTLKAVGETAKIVWVAGRLIGLSGSLFLEPASALVRVDEAHHLVRLT